MILSGIYIISFILLVFLIMLFPKTNKKEMFLTELSIGIVTVLCYAILCAQIFSIIGIAVNLKSMSVTYIVFSVLLLFILLKSKKVQHFYIDWFQLGSVLILSIIFLIIELKTFSYEMRASFYNSFDAGGHFLMAINVVKNQAVDKMPFTPFHNGMMIEVLKPVLSEYKYYKAFVLADSLHYYFELIFFYSLTLEFTNKKITKYLAPIITLLYWLGYPLFSYVIGNFVYWGWGVILCGYVVFAAHRLYKDGRKYIYCTEIILGVIGVISCYMLFVPPLLIGVAFLLYPSIKDILSKNKRNTIIVVGIFLSLLVIVMYSFWIYFGNSITSILDALRMDGFIYSNIGSDFLLTLPLILAILQFSKRKNKVSIFMRFFIADLGYTMIMLILVLTHFMSRYYYYKYYYLVWLFWWLVIINGIDEIEIHEEARAYIKPYIWTVIVSYVICFTRIDKLLPSEMKENGMAVFGTDLYMYNFSFLDHDYEEYKYTTNKMDINMFVKENLMNNGEDALFLNYYNDGRSEATWYQAITGGPIRYVLEDRLKDNWKQAIVDKEFNYYVVMKNSIIYVKNQDFFKQYVWIFENEEGFVMKNEYAIGENKE